jgi:hypothetical protein
MTIAGQRSDGIDFDNLYNSQKATYADTAKLKPFTNGDFSDIVLTLLAVEGDAKSSLVSHCQ